MRAFYKDFFTPHSIPFLNSCANVIVIQLIRFTVSETVETHNLIVL